MTNIVERLREAASMGVPDFTNSKLLDEAADEVERLRDENTLLWGSTPLKEAREEIERLRVELTLVGEKIAEMMDEIERLRAKQSAALQHAQRLALILWEEHWQADNPNWKVGEDLLMVIDQIDNAVAGLVKP